MSLFRATGRELIALLEGVRRADLAERDDDDVVQIAGTSVVLSGLSVPSISTCSVSNHVHGV